MSLSQELRAATADAHACAERSGFVAALLRGRGTRDGYCLYLRNLLPAYRALEEALVAAPALVELARPELFRSSALEQDLHALAGDGWEHRVMLLSPARAYARRIEQVAARRPRLLAAHAYVRYLGDLSGGLILARVLRRSLGLDDDCLCFHRFPGVAQPQAFKVAYRQALDRLGERMTDVAAIAGEARDAFRHNIAVSEAVALAAGPPREDAVQITGPAG